jgi:D-alanyl-lipoteichoic acid acyltransferase DltB (MBOAT superfamily)
MLFNSHVFLFVFLPVTLLVYAVLGRRQRLRGARLWLVAASLFFYGWWDPRYVPLLLGSVAFNFGLGTWISTTSAPQRARRLGLAAGVTANLLVLGWFKYAYFVAENWARLSGAPFGLPPIVLPLAISFYTFQQIAFLVDQLRRPGSAPSWLDYTLFVTFFPQLIAGPIVHHRETVPQFASASTYRVRRRDLEVGITILAIGLFKKVVLADGIALEATRTFEQVSLGASPDAFACWAAALAYTFQLYFDFSGYSDMAIGLARLFGVRLPLNFDSPYKATSVIEFWRRWHMTLSRFLRDQVYIPLGGNRRGTVRRYTNLMITMLLGGLWHGAGWTFVLWGGLHGVYLLVNHGWRALRARVAGEGGTARPGGWPARVLTFLAVMLAWVVFRAPTVDDAVTVLAGMAGRHGLAWPEDGLPRAAHLAGLLALVWLAPSTQAIMARFEPALGFGLRPRVAPAWLTWRPTPAFAVAAGLVTLIGILGINRYSEFLYFQF